MTQGNAMDARPDVRSVLLSEVGRMLATAEVVADTCGDDDGWYQQEHLAGLLDGYDTPQSDAAFIAAHNPRLMLRLWTGIKEEIERHTDEPTGAESLRGCRWCNHDPAGPFFPIGGACPGLLRLAALLGLGDGADEPTRKCPTCGSPDPSRHPAVQWEGEVQLCSDPFHSAAPSPAPAQGGGGSGE